MDDFIVIISTNVCNFILLFRFIDSGDSSWVFVLTLNLFGGYFLYNFVGDVDVFGIVARDRDPGVNFLIR